MIASSFLHPIAIPPHQGADTRVPVLRREPCPAIGVTRSVGLVTRPAEGALLRVPFLPVLERLALQGWPLLSGSLSFRIRSCLQALTVCLFVPCRASPLRLNGIN